MELFDSAFFDFDFPEFVTGLALRDVLERTQLLALHEGTTAWSFSEFRLLAIRIAFQLFEMRAFNALTDLFLEAASLNSGGDSDAFFARITLSTLGRWVLKRSTLLLGTAAFILGLLQFLALFAFNRFEFAVVGLDILALE